MVARGGSLNLIGALASGLLQFALVVVVTRSLTKGGAGAFFEALAVFVILTNIGSSKRRLTSREYLLFQLSRPPLRPR